MSGRTYKAMAKAALTDSTIAKRIDLYKFRVEEELYDFKNDPDGLVNLIDDPGVQNEKRRLKELLYAEMKRSEDPWRSRFKERFMQWDIIQPYIESYENSNNLHNGSVNWIFIQLWRWW